MIRARAGHRRTRKRVLKPAQPTGVSALFRRAVEVTGTEGTLRIGPAFWFNVDRELAVERED